jgi:hypothetical protein
LASIQVDMNWFLLPQRHHTNRSIQSILTQFFDCYPSDPKLTLFDRPRDRLAEPSINVRSKAFITRRIVTINPLTTVQSLKYQPRIFIFSTTVFDISASRCFGIDDNISIFLFLKLLWTE